MFSSLPKLVEYIERIPQPYFVRGYPRLLPRCSHDFQSYLEGILYYARIIEYVEKKRLTTKDINHYKRTIEEIFKVCGLWKGNGLPSYIFDIIKYKDNKYKSLFG